MASRLRPLLVAAILLTVPRAALADPTAADKQRARQLMDRGDKLVETRDLRGALDLYREADGIMAVPSTAIEVARAELALGHLLAAREAAVRVRELPKKAGEPEPFVKARADADKMIADLDARIPELTVRVEGLAAGAAMKLTIDGREASAEGGAVKLEPGKHTARVSGDSFPSASEEVTLAEGQRKTVVLKLAAPPPVAPEPPAKSGVGPLAIIGFSAGGAFLLAGGITGGISLSQTASIKKQCDPTCPASQQSKIDGATALANASNATIAIGLAGVAVGIVGLVIGRKADPPAAAGTTLILAPLAGGAAAGLQGTF